MEAGKEGPFMLAAFRWRVLRDTEQLVRLGIKCRLIPGNVPMTWTAAHHLN